MKITRRGKAVLLVGVFGGAMLTGMAWSLPDPGMSLPPCATEDTIPRDGCSWDASEQGNGTGADFWVVQDSQRGTCYTYPGNVDLNMCVPPRHDHLEPKR